MLVTALALAWIFLAPLALKGQNTYLITSGISMLPNIERGDLVVTRRAGKYRVGDVVAYRDPNIGAVLHRIIKEEGGRFVVQGDNNDFIDPYRPAQSDVMGRLWIHIPGVSQWLARAREPRNAALLAVAGGMVFAAPIGASQARGGRRRHGYGGGGSRSAPPPMSSGGLTLGPAGQVVGVIVGVFALLSIVLAVLAFSNPTQHRASVPISYEQHGQFNYQAVADNAVYASGMAVTGQPVYRELADEMTVDFDYELVTDATADVRGAYRVDAVISQDDGWTRWLPVVPQTAFSGPAVHVRGVLDLDAVQAEIDSARKQAGLDGQPLRSFSVALVPTVTIEGTLGSAGLNETFAPELGFIVEPLVVRPATDGAEAETSPFAPSTIGTVNESRTVSNSLTLPGYELDIALARGLAQLGLGLSVAGGLVLLVLIGYASHADEPARIRSRYGPLLITLRGSDLGDEVRLIEVASIDDLVKVAEREGRMVLHQESGSIHQYFVQDVDVTYRYQTQPVPAVRAKARAESVS